MSHLSTIIQRIKRTIETEEDPMDDPLMKQHVRNLREYPRLWDDATEEELELRKELLEEQPWNVEVMYTAECLAGDCDWHTEKGTEDEISEATNDHYYNGCESDAPAPVWDKELLEG